MSFDKKNINYWHWFFKGYKSKPGWRSFVDRWLVAHSVIGIVLANHIAKPIDEVANTVLLPLTGILIGLTFAWIGNAISILQSKEIKQLSESVSGGIVEYVFAYQNAVLVLLVTIVCWGLAGMEAIPLSGMSLNGVLLVDYEIILYALSSMALRECWHVTLFSQQLLITKDMLDR